MTSTMMKSDDGACADDDTLLLQDLQNELRSDGVITSLGARMVGRQYLHDMRAKAKEDSQNKEEEEVNTNGEISMFDYTSILPLRARDILKRAVHVSADAAKAQVNFQSTLTNKKQQQQQECAKSAFSSWFEDADPSFTTSVRQINKHSNGEEEAASTEFFSTMQRLSSLGPDAVQGRNSARVPRKSRRASIMSMPSTTSSNPHPRRNSFGNLAQSFCESIGSALNLDLKDEADDESKDQTETIFKSIATKLDDEKAWGDYSNQLIKATHNNSIAFQYVGAMRESVRSLNGYNSDDDNLQDKCPTGGGAIGGGTHSSRRPSASSTSGNSTGTEHGEQKDRRGVFRRRSSIAARVA